MEYKIDITKLDVEKLCKLSPGQLTDMGICPIYVFLFGKFTGKRINISRRKV